MEADIRICPVCEKETDRRDMNYTTDSHGIVVRLVCDRCYPEVMKGGYDCSTVPYGEEDGEEYSGLAAYGRGW